MEESLDQISPILPIDFFTVTYGVQEGEWKKGCQKKHRLPDFSDFLYENSFVHVRMGWNQKGLMFTVEIEKPFEECFFPEFRKGDSVELWIDTRDLKSAGFVTRFCHHFVFLPKPIENIQTKEVTTFRTEDRHELADLSECFVHSEFFRKSYQMEIALPSECIYGYDPVSFDRLGFAYRINGVKKEPNHFTVSSEYLHVEQHPNRWASLQLR